MSLLKCPAGERAPRPRGNRRVLRRGGRRAQRPTIPTLRVFPGKPIRAQRKPRGSVREGGFERGPRARSNGRVHRRASGLNATGAGLFPAQKKAPRGCRRGVLTAGQGSSALALWGRLKRARQSNTADCSRQMNRPPSRRMNIAAVPGLERDW